MTSNPTDVYILSPVRNYPGILRYFLASIKPILDARPQVHLVLFDNDSNEATKDVLRGIDFPRTEVVFQSKNKGKANSMNPYVRAHFGPDRLPQVLISLDSDITFPLASFDALVEAVTEIPDAGMISMRYEKNACCPESRLYFPAKKVKGRNGQTYRLKQPFLCNVAGGVIGVSGEALRDVLHFELYGNAQDKVYYPDDANLYDRMKAAGRINGYLEGSLATHWKSGSTCLIPD